MRLQSLMILATTCSLGAVATAQAETFGREQTQVVVSAKGVDFRDPDAVASFDERLRQAAIRACDSQQPRVLAVRAADRQCARESWEAAVRQVDRPLLSQLHGRKIEMAASHASIPHGE